MLEHGKKENFDTLVNSGTVLVDFYADWCGPCKMLGPVLEELASTRGTKVIKINVDEEEELARRFGVMSIPTLVLYKDGKEIDKKIGFMALDEIKEWTNE